IDNTNVFERNKIHFTQYLYSQRKERQLSSLLSNISCQCLRGEALHASDISSLVPAVSCLTTHTPGD
ncbi:hypothetical protein BgiMline_035379, partial [Biomphalaria glabrata]